MSENIASYQLQNNINNNNIGEKSNATNGNSSKRYFVSKYPKYF